MLESPLTQACMHAPVLVEEQEWVCRKCGEVLGYQQVPSWQQLKHTSHPRDRPSAFKLWDETEQRWRRIPRLSQFIECPKCGHVGEVVKDGVRENRSDGTIQRYECRNCGKGFILRDNYKFKFNMTTLKRVLELHRQNKSTRVIAALLSVKISHVTIARWIKRFDNEL